MCELLDVIPSNRGKNVEVKDFLPQSKAMLVRFLENPWALHVSVALQGAFLKRAHLTLEQPHRASVVLISQKKKLMYR
jgi:hypothetical protein